MIRVFIADDHELIRMGVKKVIRTSKDIRIVGEASNIAEMLQFVPQTKPDIVVLDINFPEDDGLKGLMTLRRLFPELPVLILSMFPEERFAIRALKAGAAGYISKAMAAEELVEAIRKVMSVGTYISPRTAEILALDYRNPGSTFLHNRLASRELQIVSLLGSGKQIKQIAAELSISISTVNTYRVRIFKKMGLRSNAELIRYAVEQQLVD